MSNALALNSHKLAAFMEAYQQRVNHCLQQTLKRYTSADPKLQEAMAYSLLSNGKRIRPLLVYGAALAINDDTNPLTDAAACALEAIHCYSLVHDDLPAMDDDDLRRGQPTNHKVFGEAMAILAGDGLQTLAFECLSEPTIGRASQQLQMLHILAQASGDKGMAAGQAIDLAAVNHGIGYDHLLNMHRLKTGALIRASIHLGALSSGAATESQISQLLAFADNIGLAFQVQDDILDVTADTSTLGKQQGADAAHNKPTFASLLGLEKAQEKADTLFQQALEHIQSLGDNANYLRLLGAYVVQRPY